MFKEKKNPRRFIDKRKIELLFYLLSHSNSLFFV